MVSDSLLTGQDSYFKGHLFNVGVMNSNVCETFHESNTAASHVLCDGGVLGEI